VGAKLAQGFQPLRSDNLLRRFGASAERPFDRPSIRGEDRAEGESDVDLLAGQPTAEEHHEVFDGDCLAGPHGLVHRSDRRPDLGPGLAAGASEDVRMLRIPEKGNVGIIVKERQARTEPENNWEPRGETDAE
jgi:hypothetical protein